MSSSHSSRPAYPQNQSSVSSASSSSTTSSAYQSSSSLPSLVMPSFNSATRQAAPLPSPIAQQPPSLQYGSLHPSSHQQQLRSQGLGTSNFDYRPDRTGAARTAAETGQFLRDYSLVAEAAKRAQMAVLARDMESMEM